MMVAIAGGDGLYSCGDSGRRNVDSGTGCEITEPKNEMFAIHFDDSRGSTVREEPLQYLLERQLCLLCYDKCDKPSD